MVRRPIIASGSVTVGTIGVAAAWSNGDEDDGKNNSYGYAKLDHTYGDGSVAVYYRQGEVGRSRRLAVGRRCSHTAWAAV